MMNKRFDTSQPTPLAPPRTPFKEARRESTRAPTPEDYSVPMRWSLSAGFLSAVFIVAVYLLGARLDWWAADFVISVLVFVLVFVAVCVVEQQWFKREMWSGLNAISTLETITGFDLNQDGAVGPPPVVQPSFLIEQVDRNKGGARWDRVEPVGHLEDFATFAFAALKGQSMAMDAWTGKYKPWSRSDYITNREKLRTLGWIRWVDDDNHSLGLEMLDEGREGFAQWLEQSASTRAHATGDVQVIDPPQEGSGGTIQALPEPGAGEREDERHRQRLARHESNGETIP